MVVHPLTGIYKQGGSLRKVPPTQGKLLKEFMKGQCVKVLNFHFPVLLMIHHRSSRLMSLVQMFNQLTIFFLSFFLGKKKSKFQTFKKLFARKKRKEAAGAEAGMKSSQSSDNVSKTSEENTLTRSEKETGSG